jgi:hypothetical protein
MSALQIVRSRPDPVSIGVPSFITASRGVDKTSQIIESRLEGIVLPSPTFLGDRPTAKNLEEQLYDSLANFKIKTATVAMHLDRAWRSRLFRQLDSLLAIQDWEADDPPPSVGSFATFLRMLMLLRPTRPPGLGASGDGNLIAAWTVGDDRLTIECKPSDIVRWHLSVTIDGERERSAAITPLRRLADVLRPYGPGRWFEDANNVSAG